MAEKVEKDLTFYQRINKVKIELKGLSSSGKNEFGGWKYTQLTDFLENLNILCEKYNIFNHITVDREQATLIILDCLSDKTSTYTIPVADIQMKGCNAIQNLGSVQTYARRYLYLMAYDIAIADDMDKKTNTNTEEVPTYEQIEQWCLDNKAPVEIGQKFFEYWQHKGWKNQKGEPINWLRNIAVSVNKLKASEANNEKQG